MYDYSGLPNELTSKPQFVLWNYEEVNGKQTKIPYQVNGEKARTGDRNTFASFPTALKFYRTGQFDGMGFVFTAQDNFVGIDIDHCITYSEDDINKENPIYSELATEIIDSLDSFTEISPSLTGVHIIVKGSLPPSVIGSGRKNSELGLELYSRNRFFTLSNIRENDNEIEEREEELHEIFEKYFSHIEEKENPVANLSKYDNDDVKMSNDQILEKMFNSKNGAAIKALYEGKLINDDHSSSDQALCNHLAFWTGNSASRIDAIFRQSGLMRDKWDLKRGDYLYGEMTIANAIASTHSTVVDYQSVDGNEFKFNFNKVIPEKDLQKILTQRHHEELANLRANWEVGGEKGKEPTILPPKFVANILQEYVKFVLFDLDESTRLSMYVASEGIYSSNTTYIKRVISWLEPGLNDAKASDVIYHITNDAEVKPRTESRFLIAVNNGVFNLKTKELMPFSCDYVFTSKIATNYNPAAHNISIDGWDVESWLDSIACGDKEISTLLWQVINEALNGNYTRKKSIFLLGEGNNGKGTFQDLLINLIGFKNVASLKVNEFDERFKLSLLEGKTVVIGDDVQAGVKIDDSSNFNSVVTGDSVQVEQKNKPMYNTVYRCAVIQSTNGMPTFKNKTTGTLRRLIIVPFNADFNGEQENFAIKETYIKTKEVLEYVLYKAINLDFERFSVPGAAEQQLKEFEIDNNNIYEFYTYYMKDNEIKTFPKFYLHNLFAKFAKNNNYDFVPIRKFFKELAKITGNEWEERIVRISEKEINELQDFNFDYSLNDYIGKTVRCICKFKLKIV